MLELNSRKEDQNVADEVFFFFLSIVRFIGATMISKGGVFFKVFRSLMR